jgi:hypothetical protein
MKSKKTAAEVHPVYEAGAHVAKNKWIVLDNLKIYENGLWEIKDISNPLSELVEISKLKHLGFEDDIHVYLCEEPPSEIVKLMTDISEDNHVYLGVRAGDKNQTAMVWPY